MADNLRRVTFVKLVAANLVPVSRDPGGMGAEVSPGIWPLAIDILFRCADWALHFQDALPVGGVMNGFHGLPFAHFAASSRRSNTLQSVSVLTNQGPRQELAQRATRPLSPNNQRSNRKAGPLIGANAGRMVGFGLGLIGSGTNRM